MATTLSGRLLAAALLAVLAQAEGSTSDTIELVETFPVETTLDQADLREAYEVWPERLAAAKERVDMGWFYVSDSEESRLAPVLSAVTDAAERGVAVRILADRGFHATYPEPLNGLDAREGIEVRLFDVRATMGGVLHAKYFLVDGCETWLGSQNFDWRSLEHIQELGVLVRSERVTRAFGAVFEADWALAGGDATEVPAAEAPPTVELALGTGGDGERVRVTPVASPKEWLPNEAYWDLPRMVALIDAAQSTVRVQLLTYRSRNRDGSDFDTLESALERAAARGASVQLLVADWGKRPGTIDGLKELVQVEGIEVRMMSIPQWSGGFVPFARVIHSKYLVVDGRAAWIGTSNWEHGYFHQSRNLGLIVEGAAFGARLDEYFTSGWDSDYAEVVDPARAYEVPRIGR